MEGNKPKDFLNPIFSEKRAPYRMGQGITNFEDFDGK